MYINFHWRRCTRNVWKKGPLVEVMPQWLYKLWPGVCHIMAWNWVNIGSGNGLLSDSKKPLLEHMLTNHQWGFVVLNWGRFQRICSRYLWYTVETLYNTIYYSKYFIELNFDKSTQYVALWTHKRHPIPRPFGRAMECLLWVLQQKLTVL